MAIAGELQLKLEGVFDVDAAARVAEALAMVRPGGALHVDLAQVRDFPDAGLAALARILTAGGHAVRVVLGGLCQHQVRILGYLGVDVDALAAMPAGMPA